MGDAHHCSGPRLRNDLYSVEWNFKLYYTIPNTMHLRAVWREHEVAIILCIYARSAVADKWQSLTAPSYSIIYTHTRMCRLVMHYAPTCCKCGGGEFSTFSVTRPVIYPDPQGGYNPQFSCDTPQPSEVQRGLSGGCLCDLDGRGNKRGQILT